MCIDHRSQLPLTTKKSRKSARETRYDGGVDGGGNTGGGNGAASRVVVERAVGAMGVEAMVVEMMSAVREVR